MTVAELRRDRTRYAPHPRHAQTVYENHADSHDPYGVKRFLTDGTIGTLTGASKIWADLDMFDAPFHHALPTPVRARALAAMAVNYILREDYGRLNELKRNMDPLTPELIHELYMEHRGMKKTDHKVHVLLYGQKELERQKKEIEREIKMNTSLREEYCRSDMPQETLERMVRDLDNVGYNLLRQRLGIALSEYDLKGAQSAINDIKGVPDRYLHEANGHTNAIIHWWEDGGNDELRTCGKFKVVPLLKDAAARSIDHSYWLRRKIGTDEHPGVWRHTVETAWDESKWAILTGIGNLAFWGWYFYKHPDQFQAQLHTLQGFLR